MGGMPTRAQAAPNVPCTNTADGVYWQFASSWTCGHVPTSVDDVIIYSGQSVNMGDPEAKANNLTINGTLYMQPLYLLVNGTLTIPSGGRLEPSGIVDLRGSGGLNLMPGGSLTVGDATWYFTGFGVQSVSGNPTFNKVRVDAGSILDMGTGSVTVSSTVTNNGIIRATRNIGSSDTNYTFSLAGGPVNAANLGIYVTSDSFTSITVDRVDSNHPSASNPIKTGMYWTITPFGTGTVNLTLPVNFVVSDTPPDLVCRYTGSGVVWDCAADAHTTDTITRNGISSFSDWAAGNNVGPTAIRQGQLNVSSTAGEQTLPAMLTALGLLVVAGLFFQRKLGR
jgi:hypothetical protein